MEVAAAEKMVVKPRTVIAPKLIRFGAVLLLVSSVIALIWGFLKMRDHRDFRMKSFPTTLSKEIAGEVLNYERNESENGVLKYRVRAERALTFTDNHQELENCTIELFNEGEIPDSISAEKAVYIPAEEKKFKAFFSGNVKIESHDGLKIQTDQISYDSAIQQVITEEKAEFSRENVTGKAVGAVLNIGEKRLQLHSDVEITAIGAGTEDQIGKNGIRQVTVKSHSADFREDLMIADFLGDVRVDSVPNGADSGARQPTHVRAERANARFSETRKLSRVELSGGSRLVVDKTAEMNRSLDASAARINLDLADGADKAEMIDSVAIVFQSERGDTTNVTSQYALFDKRSLFYKLDRDVIISGVSQGKHFRLASNMAEMNEASSHISMVGNVAAEGNGKFLSGERLNADIFPDKSLKHGVLTGNAFVRDTANGGAREIRGDVLSVDYSQPAILSSAVASRNPNLKIIPANPSEYRTAEVKNASVLTAIFRNDGSAEKFLTNGRTTIVLSVANNAPDAANKQLTADNIVTILDSRGEFITRAEAEGNAEISSNPLRASKDNYETNIRSQRVECDFYQKGNTAKVCNLLRGVTFTRNPTVTIQGKGAQKLSGNNATALFDERTGDISKFETVGDAKFNELDANGASDSMTYTAADSTIRLRGGEPVFWNSRGRAKAPEMDWDTNTNVASLRGGVTTTYYSVKKSEGSLPFGATNNPVFITAATAEIDNKNETAVYSGNARAWQESNYVRGDSLVIRQKEGTFDAFGNVQSMIYNIRRKDAATKKEIVAPVSVSAAKMHYERAKQTITYEQNVEINQIDERITGATAVIYLSPKNEVQRLDVSGKVTVRSPLRQADGDDLFYDAVAQTILLKGSPAHLSDVEKGRSEGAQIFVKLQEKAISAIGASPQAPTGRIRSVYKIEKKP